MPKFLYGLSFACGAAGFLTAAVILFFQAAQWLKLGVWIPVTVLDAFVRFGWDYPFVTWLGVQKMIDFIMESSLGITCIIVGLIAAFFLNKLAKEAESEAQSTHSSASNQKPRR